jgi:hypothetical protein
LFGRQVQFNLGFEFLNNGCDDCNEISPLSPSSFPLVLFRPFLARRPKKKEKEINSFKLLTLVVVVNISGSALLLGCDIDAPHSLSLKVCVLYVVFFVFPFDCHFILGHVQYSGTN